jgi:UDP-N-acetylmuramate dehydrogenase
MGEAPLARFTTFGVGGPAEILAHPRSPEELAALVRRAHKTGMPLRVLGAGSNVLVADEGVRGMVVRLAAPPFKELALVGEEIVHCGGGSRLSRVVKALADWGLTGAEGLAGIPGTVGGALVMNAGTSAGEIGPLVRRVWALEPDGSAVSLAPSDCRFEYRSSALGGKLILGAELLLSSGEASAIRARLDELHAKRKGSQPRGVRTAGCVFKNPPGERAGALLDESGLKGFTKGCARVSPVHANFIEAESEARAADVKALIDEMRRRVREERGIELELELGLWGFEDEGGNA